MAQLAAAGGNGVLSIVAIAVGQHFLKRNLQLGAVLIDRVFEVGKAALRSVIIQHGAVIAEEDVRAVAGGQHGGDGSAGAGARDGDEFNVDVGRRVEVFLDPVGPEIVGYGAVVGVHVAAVIHANAQGAGIFLGKRGFRDRRDAQHHDDCEQESKQFLHGVHLSFPIYIRAFARIHVNP